MNRPKRSLKIDLEELETAMGHQDATLEIIYFLDVETGRILMTTGEDRSLLEEVYQEYADPETGKVNWPEVIPQLGLPDWQVERLMEADEAESGYGERYIAIPQTESYEGYNEMVDFIDGLPDSRLKASLEQAIHGKGAFRRFKDILVNYPEERENWFQYRDQCARQRVTDWLEAKGIELIQNDTE